MPDTPDLLFDGPATALVRVCCEKLLRGRGKSRSEGPAGAHTTRVVARRRRVREPSGMPGVADDGAEPHDGKYRYPEWDSRLGRYRADWCSVREIDPDATGGSVPPPDLGVRRPLAKLGSGADTRHRQRYGDDIDIDAAIESRVETRTSGNPGDALYLATVHDRRDLSARSSSTSRARPPNPAPAASRCDHQRTTVAALASTIPAR